jgi:tripartite motif-containing protein 71
VIQVQGFLSRVDAGSSHRRRRPRGFAATVSVLPLLAVFAAGSSLTGAQAGASATPSSPTYVRTIGTSGESTMYPSGVAVDASGNVYVADTGNYKIEKYTGTTLDWSVGVRGAPIGGGTDSFIAPRDVATDGTFVYVGDTDNAIVQVLKASDGSFVKQVKTFGSGGSLKFQDPIGISVGHNASNVEEILVSDGVSGNVYVFDASFNWQFTVAPTNPTEGTRDAATDSSGNIYTADYRGNKVDKYTPTGTLISSWGSATGCKDVAKPYGIDIDANNHVYVASSNLEQIMVFDTSGNCLNVGTTGSNAIGTKVTSPSPTGLFQLRRVAVGPGTSPLVYAADLWGLKILAYKSTDGSLVSMLGSGIYPPAGGLNEVHGIAIDSSSTPNYVFATNTVNQRMERFNLDGTNPFYWGVKGVVESAASFNWAQGVAVDPTGNVWVANTRNNRIDEFKSDGTKLASCPNTARLSSGLNWPMAVTFDPSGTMYVADTFNMRVIAISVSKCTASTTTVPTIWSVGTRGTGTNQFVKPWNLVYDPTLKRILVTDTFNSRIVSLDAATGNWLGVLPISKGTAAGQITMPEGIAVDAAGDIWVADTGNNRIEEFTSTGTFTGQMIGSYGTSGNASFNAPQGLAFDSAGLLYVADANNNRIQVYTPSATSSVIRPSLIANTTPVFQRDIFNAGGIAPMYPAGGGTDSGGTMWIADSGGSRIDKISGGTLTYVTPTSGAALCCCGSPRSVSSLHLGMPTTPIISMSLTPTTTG